METWHRLSALGGAGTLGVWRSSLLVLSTGLLDPRRCARRGAAVENDTGRVLLDRTGACGNGHVPPCPAVASGSGRNVCRRVLRAESLPLADRVLAQRLCRTTGVGVPAPSA